MKTEKFYWACVTPDGRLAYWTIRFQRQGAVSAMLADLPPKLAGDWRTQYRRGWRVTKICITEYRNA